MNYATQLKALHNAMVHRQADAMLDHIKPTRADVLGANTRLSVYTDGYLERLVDATLSDYPALAHYMGKESCRAAVNAFVQTTPSTFWDLNLYPFAFAQFITQHSPDTAAHALAKLESAIAEVFWLPESSPLTADALAGLSEEDFGNQHFALRTAARLLKLDYVANAYLTAFRNNAPLADMEQGSEYLLVIRSDNEVQRPVLEPEEFAILEALQQEETFNEALLAVENQTTLAEKLPHFMARWLTQGVFSLSYPNNRA